MISKEDGAGALPNLDRMCISPKHMFWPILRCLSPCLRHCVWLCRVFIYLYQKICLDCGFGCCVWFAGLPENDVETESSGGRRRVGVLARFSGAGVHPGPKCHRVSITIQCSPQSFRPGSSLDPGRIKTPRSIYFFMRVGVVGPLHSRTADD
jgi:hypothetical protein